MHRNHLAAGLAVLFVLGASRGVGAQTPPTPDVCSGLERLVPSAAIDTALASPDRVSGWAVPANRNLRASRFNSIRKWLSIRNPNIPFHPLFNGVQFVSACPLPPPTVRPCDKPDEFPIKYPKGGWIAFDWASLGGPPVDPLKEANLCGTGKGRYKPYISKPGGGGGMSAYCSCTDITR